MIQVVVRRDKGKWIVKTREIERAFANELAALQSAVQFAHETGKNGSPVVVLMKEDKTKFMCGPMSKAHTRFKIARRRKSRTAGLAVAPEISFPR